MITQKENYLMLLRGEQPEFVPSYGFGMMGDEPVANVMIEVSATSAFRETGGGKDPWGVAIRLCRLSGTGKHLRR